MFGFPVTAADFFTKHNMPVISADIIILRKRGKL